jgi:3-oxoacyl-[acyl-carrier-protein] synthase I
VRPLPITCLALANPLGLGVAATRAALHARRGGLRRNDFVDLPAYIGRVDGVEHEPVVSKLSEFDCRNNRLAQLGLQQDGFEEAVAQARKKYGAARIAVLIGTSTSGILETEIAYRNRGEDGALPSSLRYRHSHNVFSVADFVRQYLRLDGPAAAISTACSSSAKVFANAYRFIEAGLCDAAVVGGVDSLCGTTLYGFSSLELLSAQPCRPCDEKRDGISIGEAAGFALVEREAESEFALLGYGESCDAHHMSSPHPEGAGAHLAMSRALARAELTPEEISYVNLHGTATPANDLAEDLAVHRLFGASTPCSSTKGWTGHALGAAGISEAIICCVSLRDNLVPGTLNTAALDPQLKSRIALQNMSMPLKCAISNSFGFGGNNCALVLGKLC